jgi:hypothetical protein
VEDHVGCMPPLDPPPKLSEEAKQIATTRAIMRLGFDRIRAERERQHKELCTAVNRVADMCKALLIAIAVIALLHFLF